MNRSLPGRLAALLAIVLVLTLPSALRAAPPRGKAAPKPTATAAAEPPPSAAPAAPEPEPELHWKIGPANIELGHDLTLALPERYIFLAPPEASKLLERNGSLHNEDLVGLVAARDGNGEWFAVMRYEEEGYVKDDEKIDEAELHKMIHDGVEEANAERTERGFKPMHVEEGWAEPPRYDKSVHHLIWALIASTEGEGQSVNFNTRVLGRRGFVSINLVTDPARLTEFKPEAATLLAATAFKPGARYEDFDSSHDKVAEYGLIGLILGGAGLGAAKLVKVGLIAGLWKYIVAALLAAKKLILVGLAALGGLWKRIFGGKKTQQQP